MQRPQPHDLAWYAGHRPGRLIPEVSTTAPPAAFSCTNALGRPRGAARYHCPTNVILPGS